MQNIPEKMTEALPSFLQSPESHPKPPLDKGHGSLSFIDQTLSKLARLIKTVWLQNDTTSKNGLLQRLNARVKVIFLIYFIVIVSLTRQVSTQLYISAFLLVLYSFSCINVVETYKKIFGLSFIFGFLVVAPAALNLVSKGELIMTLVRFNSPHQFWIYQIPASIGITREGCFVVLKFFLKVTNSLAITLLIIYTTPFNEIIKSLRIFRVPDLFLLVITLAYKFIFILSQTTEETYFALKSRWWENVKGSRANKLVAGRMAYIFRKSWIKYEEIYFSMVARGFSGNVNLCYSKKLEWRDATFAVVFIGIGIFLIIN
jgi:cobalt/nickel transport system permease protein